MKITILTLFPEMFKGPFEYSIIKRALDKKKVVIEFVNIRRDGIGKHKIVDDTPYGGGTGMILRVDVIDKALQGIKKRSNKKTKQKIILLDARGEKFTQKKAFELSKFEHLILICGHYEGIDERIKDYLVNEVISIGDYVLTGGEIPAMVLTDAVVRLLPQVLKKEATEFESFSNISNSLLLEYPQYTKPQTYKNLAVPKILLSGDHKKINKWRQEQAIKTTKKQRPDLVK